ncbi:hypothetical protein EYF80_047428 [Liparis tanakae]|uniref:Uncharacterized protein n=1 Tax=Liparis tanakae TaxID=230148 RepID=A0A4Z2FND5_9TELE|nr:hypothetical protein EYF80_047428 [Liparis tanakae]
MVPPPPPGFAPLLTNGCARRSPGGHAGCGAALPGAARLYRCLRFGLTSVWGPLAGRFVLGGGCAEAMTRMAAGAQTGRRARAAGSSYVGWPATGPLKGQPPPWRRRSRRPAANGADEPHESRANQRRPTHGSGLFEEVTSKQVLSDNRCCRPTVGTADREPRRFGRCNSDERRQAAAKGSSAAHDRSGVERTSRRTAWAEALAQREELLPGARDLLFRSISMSVPGSRFESVEQPKTIWSQQAYQRLGSGLADPSVGSGGELNDP